jgi:hypothetical protein
MLLDRRTFKLTDNLESAPRNLRLRNETRWMCVDAIYIDQNNDEERSSEVQLIKLIYKSTVRVIVWLGNYHEPGDELIKWV